MTWISFWSGITATRDETFRIELDVDSNKITWGDRETIKDVFGKTIENGDALNVKFELDFEYWGKAEKTLTLIEKLIDKSSVKKVNTKELTHGRSLIQDILLKMERIEKKVI